MKFMLAAIICAFSVSSFAQVPSVGQVNANVDAAAATAKAKTTEAQAQKTTLTAQAKAAGEKAKEKALVNLNTASTEDLAKLPGIGPARAKAIIEARPYTKVEDLKKVKGIKEGVVAKLKGLVTI